MKITDIKIRRLYDRDKMKAVCSVTFDGELVVHDIKVIENDGKTFIAMQTFKRRLFLGYRASDNPTDENIYRKRGFNGLLREERERRDVNPKV